MQHTLPVRVPERGGKAAADEADGCDVIERGEHLAILQLPGVEFHRRGTRAVDGREQVGTAPRGGLRSQLAEKLVQRQRRHVLHAQDPQPVPRLLTVHGDDVRVVESGQRLAFLAATGRDLQRHAPVE